MYSYALLEPDCYYLIQEKEEEELTLLQVKVISEQCMYIEKYKENITQEWRKKSDNIHDIVELLSDNAVKEWSNAYYNNEDVY